jgi:predicted TIM-barrel fold metal-dependent hydrolase
MLTRRTALLTAGALGASAAAYVSWGSGSRLTRPGFEIPRGACDAHVHVVADPAEFPMAPDRDYTPPPATASDLAELLHFLGIDRVVIVAPTVYGADNAATIDAIARLGPDRARGVGWLPENASPVLLEVMERSGIVGFRHFLYEGGTFHAATEAKRLAKRFEIAAAHHWHIDISAPPDIVAALRTQLAAAPVPIVFDTFGWAQGGVTQPGFEAVLALAKSGSAYVKLSEPYRLSRKGPNYPDLRPVVQALVAANPDRILWGSGWPFVAGLADGNPKGAFSPNLPIDAGHLLNLFAGWVPDGATRHKILVDNPARFYGFSAEQGRDSAPAKAPLHAAQAQSG